MNTNTMGSQCKPSKHNKPNNNNGKFQKCIHKKREC